ncbi:MAG: hypothetical protein DRP71_05280 [Verrucomicrobia bacterium]|nr:MAG: hypothetical protein DRP71_05280 [Verrucomicrobiota bacterium]
MYDFGVRAEGGSFFCGVRPHRLKRMSNAIRIDILDMRLRKVSDSAFSEVMDRLEQHVVQAGHE